MPDTQGRLEQTAAEIRAQIAAESPAVDHVQWKTDIVRYGVAGVNLATGIDGLAPMELRRLTNGVTQLNGGIHTRPGLTRVIGGGSRIHSASRLNDPKDGISILIWGVDDQIASGNSGGFTFLLGGFSGNPLSISRWESEYSGEPWAYIADSARMGKVNPEGVALQIGLPTAAQPSSIVVQDPLVTEACSFTASDGTDSGSWTPIAGFGTDGHPSDTPTIYGAGDTQIVVGPGSSGKSFYSGMSIPHVVNLSTLPKPGGGTIDSTDQDLIHFWLRVTNPEIISEVRIYFVTGPYTDGQIPGVSTSSVGTQPNGSAYARAFRMSDYAAFIALNGTALDAASKQRTAAIAAALEVEKRAGRHKTDTNTTVANQGTAITTADLQQRQALANSQFRPLMGSPVDLISSAQLPGADVWVEYGIIGRPLRKADFLKIGQAGEEGFGWADVSGVVIVILTNAAAITTISFMDMYLTGGYDPDTSESDSQYYDYRICNVDKRTGARSNPSDVMYTTAENKDVLGYPTARQLITIYPQVYGDSAIYQEVYRRGGSLGDTWYGPVADNKDTGNGQPLVDTMNDITALATGTIELDHDQPVTTTDEAGNAVYNQPLGFLLPTPINGYLIGGGDIYRPGDIYWCKQSEPDHWPAFNHQQVCPPSETLMNGGVYGGQAFVFSRERMYAVQVGSGDPPVSSSPTDCAEGLIGRWAMTTGPGGIYFVSRDALRVTQGSVSKPLSDKIRPLFHGETIEGLYSPIDFTQPDQIRLGIHGDDLWFGFIDTTGHRVWWVLSLIYETWRCVVFGKATCFVYSDPGITAGLRLLVGGDATGYAYEHTGISDDGIQFEVKTRTGAIYSGSREEKLLGDISVYGDFTNTDFNVTALLDVEQVVNVVGTAGSTNGYREYIFQPFGRQPQHASSISLDITWLSGNATPTALFQYGIATAIQPEITMTRATTWQPLNTNGEAYLTGCWIDCDTFGDDVAVAVEALRGGVPATLANLVINSDAGRRLWFDWPAAHVDMVRLRPSASCSPWMLFGQGWLWRPEPAHLPIMDSGLVNLGDTYYTGLDLEVDTDGVSKTVCVEVDGTLLSDPATGFPYWTFSSSTRRVVHLTLPWGRGHIYRFYSTDAVPVLLYTSKWYVAEEPSEQTNWNQNFTIAGTLADKWIKGILLECDTFGQTKLVNVDVDGVPVPSGPFPVIANGRSVVQIAFPQVLGRVFRIFPADHFPGRLYSSAWLFDQEPYQLTRFETQEIRLGIDDWKVATYGQITYKAAAPVNLQCLIYGQDAQIIATDDYTLPATTGKAMTPFRPHARKGVLYKFILTSAAGFWLYREESWIEFQPWQGGATTKVKVVGNDDLDESRSMVNAGLVASRSGGGG